MDSVNKEGIMHKKGITRVLFLTVFGFLCVGIMGCNLSGYSDDSGGGQSGDKVVSLAAIQGVGLPVSGAVPVATITETAQYTGTVAWLPANNPFVSFTVYTATITLVPKSGYTLKGVAANYFTVGGASVVTNAADSGIVTAVFPPTGSVTGDKVVYNAGGVSFLMVYVPGALTFPTGVDDNGTATVEGAYWIGETEVTYELWKKVYDWATDASRGANQYHFANAGTQGDNGSRGIQHPVTLVSFRDSIVWCNALTEWYNAQKGTSHECVYTYGGGILRDSRDENATACDNAVANATDHGFRLPTGQEWELAARFRNDVANTVSGYTNPYFTTGNSASGATTYHNDTTGDPNFAGKLSNDIVAVYKFYWNGSAWVDNGTNSTATVKSKTPNALGLYDMSGNVWEWCFLSAGNNRGFRGGSWCGTTDYMRIGSWYNDSPSMKAIDVGLRVAKTP